MDGIDITDVSATQAAPRFEHILSSGVHRVEILRGPQGLIFGADAGGIVNITTPVHSDGLSGSINAEAGRYGTFQLGAHVAGGSERIDFAASASDYQTDGFNARSDDTVLRDDDGYENTTLHGRLGWNVSEALRVEVVARDVEGEGDYDNCGFPRSDDCTSEFDQSAWRAAADLQLGAFSHQLAYTGNQTERQFYTEGAPAFGSEGELERWSYLGRFVAGDSISLVFGADLQTEHLDDGTFDRERDQDGYYLEYQGGFGGRVFVTAGARYDDNEDFGTYTTYRVSGAYLIPLNAGELKLKGTYGTGFRAPSLYEIAYNDGAFAFPPASDTQLQEEQSEGYDLGLVWATDAGLYLEATYFDQEVSDEIYFDLVGFSGYLQGSGETDSTGVELVALVPLGESLALTGNYTYNDTDDTTGDARIRRPEHLFNLGLDWRPQAGRVVLGIHLRGAYEAQDIDGSSLDDYEVVNVNASYNFPGGLSLYGRVENLFDEDYQEVPNYNTSGAAAYAGVRYNF